MNCLVQAIRFSWNAWKRTYFVTENLQTKSKSNDVYCKKHLPEEQEHDKDYGNGLPPVEPEDQIHEDAKIV